MSLGFFACLGGGGTGATVRLAVRTMTRQTFHTRRPLPHLAIALIAAGVGCASVSIADLGAFSVSTLVSSGVGAGAAAKQLRGNTQPQRDRSPRSPMKRSSKVRLRQPQTSSKSWPSGALTSPNQVPMRQCRAREPSAGRQHAHLPDHAPSASPAILGPCRPRRIRGAQRGWVNCVHAQ
jgi:hypothetical protein